MSALAIVNKLLGRRGWMLGRVAETDLPDLDATTRQLIRSVRPYTMTSDERLNAIVEAVRYVERRRLPGDVVECGVWRGGSTMAMALELLRLGSTARTLYLFDTFEGMPAPDDESDIDATGALASALLAADPDGSGKVVARASIAEVTTNLVGTGYPTERTVYVKGLVEDTIPARAPEQIAILRLDTDWYASTAHELKHLVPRVVPGGVLVIDDYGHWQGARKAVDEYLDGPGRHLLLNRIDYTGRIAVVP